VWSSRATTNELVERPQHVKHLFSRRLVVDRLCAMHRRRNLVQLRPCVPQSTARKAQQQQCNSLGTTPHSHGCFDRSEVAATGARVRP
jgi:hypothetical protein